MPLVNASHGEGRQGTLSQLAAAHYDALYASKNYEREAHLLRDRLWRLDPSLHTVLDVACGTGVHDEYLSRFYEVDGIDANPAFLEAARRRNPRGRYHEADMRAFGLDRLYDAVLCLFSGIGYVVTYADLVRALTCFAQHLTPRGVVIVEPWLTPDVWEAPSLRWDHGEAASVQVVRMARSRLRVDDGEPRSLIEMHYLVGTGDAIEHVRETHELGLFTPAQMLDAFAAAGLGDVTHEEDGGLTGRGLYVARAAEATTP